MTYVSVKPPLKVVYGIIPMHHDVPRESPVLGDTAPVYKIGPIHVLVIGVTLSALRTMNRSSLTDSKLQIIYILFSSALLSYVKF